MRDKGRHSNHGVVGPTLEAPSLIDSRTGVPCAVSKVKMDGDFMWSGPDPEKVAYRALYYFLGDADNLFLTQAFIIQEKLGEGYLFLC